jgi:hypothetical protein
MLLILVGLALGFLAAGWGWNPALREVAKRRPLEPLNTERNSFEVDPFIWSDQVPPAMRRRYIIAMFGFSLGMALVGIGAWRSNDPRGQTAAMLFLAGACFSACVLSWKIIRRTRGGISQRTVQTREAVTKTSEWRSWYDVLEPREAVIAGIVGLAVVWPLMHYAIPVDYEGWGRSHDWWKGIGLAIMMLGFAVPYWLVKWWTTRR